MREFALSILILFCFACSVEAGEKRFYVGPDGKSSNPGRENAPFATLSQARDGIRALKAGKGLPRGGVTVHVKGGRYFLRKPFILRNVDSGTRSASIAYQAEPNAIVHITGGRTVSGFKRVAEGNVRKRLSPDAREHVLVTNLKKQGITNYGEMKRRGFGIGTRPAALELFFDDEPMQIARYPNEGWLKISGVPKGSDGGQFEYSTDRPRNWTSHGDLWVHGYWKHPWADSYEKVKTLDAEERTVTTQRPHGVYGYHKGGRFYFLNVLEELDQPGEWYLDRDTGRLYFWPPADIDSGRAVVSVSNQLVSLKNVSHVKIRGFIFEAARGDAITIAGGTGNEIAGCVLRNVGNRAVVIENGTKQGVRSCDIYHTGEGGIRLSGGDRKTLSGAHLYAENNHIHHFSRRCRTYRPAISLHGVGNRISHNLMHHGPHTAVLFGGNENILEFNEIHHVCQKTGDVGAFYAGRDWTQRGNVIRHNFFHHITGPYTHGAMSVYLDDAFSGTTILGNVFYRASHAAFIGGGRDNKVLNNIFVDCHPAVHIDARGLGWAKEYSSRGGGWHMYEKLRRVNYDQPPYSNRYPHLASIAKDNPQAPKYNEVRRNVCVGGEWLEISRQIKDEWNTITNNFVTDQNPGFQDPKGLDFRLKGDSEPFRKIRGFQQVPFERMGLVEDNYRKSLPDE